MPTVAKWVDELREALGRDVVDAAIRDGMQGRPTFHAAEAGHEVGTPLPTHPGVPLTQIQPATRREDAAAARQDGRQARKRM